MLRHDSKSKQLDVLFCWCIRTANQTSLLNDNTDIHVAITNSYIQAKLLRGTSNLPKKKLKEEEEEGEDGEEDEETQQEDEEEAEE